MWKETLDSLVNKEISVLLDGRKCPLMFAMKGVLQGSKGDGVWMLKCPPGTNNEGQVTPSGMLYFSEEDLTRIYDTGETSSLAS